ncbi:MAG: hypothetical protein LC798_13685 [Chloroflexi bacterium]|nr:hypothetical protein [Chloroflexota bacterium]
MTRPWILVLADGSRVGPWVASKRAARQAALRALDRRALPRGSELREWSGPARSRSAETRAKVDETARTNAGRRCDECGGPGALMVGRVGGRALRNLCRRCDR